MKNKLIPIQVIESKIYIIRNMKVMLDFDLAKLYEVETKRLNEAVKRNIERFPGDFMFQLTKDEWNNLRSQIATANPNVQKIRSIPFAFTEHGTLMLSNVLNSKKAINVSIQIIRVFDKLKQFAISQNELSGRIENLEKAFINYAKGNNENIADMKNAINYLLDITKPSKIGFKTES
ncbi:ORF6N domain-containing protein [bacterium]|nr:ORF6N domain-containing protein [bacterium]